MATKKSKGSDKPAGVAFTLGDPDGAVRWTPALLKKVFPRRELGLKPLSLDTPETIAKELTEAADACFERFEAGAKLDGADASLHAALADACAWIASGAVDKPALTVAALAYQVATVGDGFRDESLAARLVDLWAQRFGVAFALDALCESFTVAYAMGGDASAVSVPVRKARRGHGDGPVVRASLHGLALVRAPHIDLMYFNVGDVPLALSGARTPSIHLFNDECRSWMRLREHLATASVAEWEATLPRAEELVKHPSALVRHLVAFSYPERPAWAESLTGERGHVLFPMLSASVRDPSKLQYVTLEYFFQEFERCCASMLAASGVKAVAPLMNALDSVRGTPQKRYVVGLVAQVDTDEAVDALLALGDAKFATAAVEAMKTNFPERVAKREKRYSA